MASPVGPLLKPRMSSIATEQAAMKLITPTSGSQRRQARRATGAAGTTSVGGPCSACGGGAGWSGDPPGATSAMQPA
jgi:hypothetical protein